MVFLGQRKDASSKMNNNWKHQGQASTSNPQL